MLYAYTDRYPARIASQAITIIEDFIGDHLGYFMFSGSAEAAS